MHRSPRSTLPDLRPRSTIQPDFTQPAIGSTLRPDPLHAIGSLVALPFCMHCSSAPSRKGCGSGQEDGLTSWSRLQKDSLTSEFCHRNFDKAPMVPRQPFDSRSTQFRQFFDSSSTEHQNSPKTGPNCPNFDSFSTIPSTITYV